MTECYETHLSLFSLAAAMKTVENRNLLSPFFLLRLSPYTKKSVHFLSRKRTVAVMSRGQRVIIAKKSKQHTGGFVLKKAPKHEKKEAQHHFNGVVLGFF